MQLAMRLTTEITNLSYLSQQRRHDRDETIFAAGIAGPGSAVIVEGGGDLRGLPNLAHALFAHANGVHSTVFHELPSGGCKVADRDFHRWQCAGMRPAKDLQK